MIKIELKKIMTIILCSVLLCIVFTPITHADIKNTARNYSITVNYLGLKNKSTHIDLTNEDYEDIKNILQKLESDLGQSDTKFEANSIIGKALNNLHKHGLFGTIDISAIKRLCLHQNIINDDIKLPSTGTNRFINTGGDNAFCVLLSHIKGYVYDHGLLFILAVLVALSSLPFIVIFYPIGVLFNFISDAIFSLQNKKPFIPPFPHQVETRYNESYSNLISRGLYGRVDNDYTNWGFRFDAFTGVRINLGRDESLRVNESYYLGSALFVSWNYDGPH
jgi:hypothetical protein